MTFAIPTDEELRAMVALLNSPPKAYGPLVVLSPADVSRAHCPVCNEAALARCRGLVEMCPVHDRRSAVPRTALGFGLLPPVAP